MKIEPRSNPLPLGRIFLQRRFIFFRSFWNDLSPGKLRLARAGASTAGMVISKFVQISVSIITVPLMLTYLGKESYGLTMAIISFSTLFFMDMGVAEGVKLRLIECFARDDRAAAKAYTSTGFFGLMLFSMLLGGVLTLLFPHIDWRSIFNLPNTSVAGESLSLTLAISLTIIIILVPLNLLREIVTANQRAYLFSIFTTGGILCSLLAVYTAIKLDLGMPGIVIGLQGCTLAAYVAMWIFFLFHRLNWILPRWRHISLAAFQTMWQDCLIMFLMSLGFLAINGMDIFIINHFLNQSDAATYSVAIRLFIYVDYLLALMLYPLWPALGEAIQKGEREWVRKTSDRILIGALCLCFALLGGVLMFGRAIIEIWTRGMVHSPLPMHVLLGFYFAVRAITAVHGTLLRAHGQVRIQGFAQITEGILHLALGILLIQRMGLIGMPIGAIISIALTQGWILPLQYWRLRKGYMGRPKE